MIARYTQNHKKGIIAALLIFAALNILGFTNAEHTTKEEQTIVNLSFTPVPVVELPEEGPAPDYVLAKSVTLKDLQAHVHFYVQQKQASGENNDVYGYIQHKDKLYNIGTVGAYGLEKVAVETVDRTGDKQQELQIIGDMGATYKEMSIIKYDENKNKWYNLVKAGSPEFLDLDGDGKEEVFAVSTGSLPGYVDIYRFDKGSCEVASITDDTANDYANLYQENGVYLIETGKIRDGRCGERYLYKYDQGKLVQLTEQKNEEFPNPPQITVPVDWEEVRNKQRQVDEGHQPGKLNAVQVAREFISEYSSPQVSQTVINYELEQFNERVAVIKIVGGSSNLYRVYLQRLVRQDETGIWSVVGYDLLSEKEKEAAEEGKLVAELPEKAIRLYSMKEEEEMLEKFILKVNDKTRYFYWVNVANPTYYPKLILADLNNDQEQELVVTLVKDTGTGVYLEEVHIIALESLREIEVENPLHIIYKNVQTQLSPEKVEIIIKGKSRTLGSEYLELEPEYIFEDVAFVSIRDFEVEDNKLKAIVPGQFGLCSFIGDIIIEYKFNGKMYIGDSIDFVPND